jgi:hypothetical protein
VLEASAPPPCAVLDLLSRHKAYIVTLLQGQGGQGQEGQVLFGFTAMSGASSVQSDIPISNGKPPSRFFSVPAGPANFQKRNTQRIWI